MKRSTKSPFEIVIPPHLMDTLFDKLVRYFESKNIQGFASVTKDSIEDWVNVKTAMHLLQIGRTKLQQLKNDGAIRFTQDGKKLRFSRRSIEKYLNDHAS
jgi:excisionase family DNA binding protein